MFRLNLIALLLFFAINVLAYRLCREQFPVCRRTVRIVCAVLLTGNLVRYLVVYPVFCHVIQIPAEFSTVAYFAVPVIVLSRERRLDSWAAYSALMAGFFYYAAMILAGQRIYGADAPADVCASLLRHGALYFIGSVSVSTEQQSRQSRGLLLFGVGYIAARAAILRPLVLGRRRMLIYILLDAIPVKLVFPEHEWSLVLPIYYGVLLAFILLSIAAFYAHSTRQYRRFSALRSAC